MLEYPICTDGSSLTIVDNLGGKVKMNMKYNYMIEYAYRML